MSFQILPVELFLDITALLPSDVDRQCLRIACRSFKRLIRPSAKPDLGDFSVTAPRVQTIKEHLDFVSRLSRDGNLFPSNRKVCSNCLRILPGISYSMASIEIDDHSVCDACIGNLLRKILSRGHKLNDKERMSTYYTCASCGVGDGSFGTRLHCAGNGVDGMSTPLCSTCHVRICHDTECRGWKPYDIIRGVEVIAK